MNELTKASWCVNAVHGMSANNDGSTKMCCMIKDAYKNSTPGGPWNLSENTIEQNFNNPKAISIRNNLQAGIRDSQCSLCWAEEDSGRKSKRMRDNEKYERAVERHEIEPYVGLAKFELNLGNTCNIKCRTCHPTVSSSWMKEDYDLNHKNITFKEYGTKMKRYHQTYDEDSPFWSDLIDNLPTIRQFDFYGGEPFMSKKMWEVLRICVEKGYSKNIELHYNTNGTLWPAEIEQWKNFKSVNLSFSIDGIESQFEYMRYLAKWDEVKTNMQQALAFKNEYPNLNLSWCVTLSSINMFYLPEILDAYYKEYTAFGLYLNLVHSPTHFNASTLPAQIKTAIVERLNKIDKSYEHAWHQLPGIIGFIEHGKYDELNWKTFVKTIDTHDVYRSQNFYETFKEYGQLIKSYDN